MSEIKNQNEIVKSEVKNAVATMKKDIADKVLDRIKTMESNQQLIFPANYAVGNALKSAYLMLQEIKDRNGKPALEVCTTASVANTLLDMVLQGLSPVKKQAYFIVYGQKLQLFRSYFGDQAAVRNAFVGKDVKINAKVIYQDDEIEIGDVNGQDEVVSHIHKFENRDKAILGAYATIIIDGEKSQEIMTKKEIDKSWAKAKTKNVQNDFPQEMTKRTVIRRLCKRFLNTSDDASLFVVEAYNRTTEDEYKSDIVDTQEDLYEQIETQANQDEFVIDGEYEKETPQTENEDKPSF